MNISSDLKLTNSIKNFGLIKNKFYKLILIFWLLGPFFFLIERSPADIWLSLVVLTFLGKSIIFKDWKWFKIKWFKFIFLFWIISLISALLSPMPIFTFGEGFFWIRFPLYAVCVQYWIGKERATRIIMLYILFLCILIMSGILLTEYFIEPKYRLTWPYGDTIPGGYLAKFCLPITCVLTSVIMTKLSSKNIFNGLILTLTYCVSFLTGERTHFLIRICSSFLAAFCLKYNVKLVLFWIIVFFTAMYITIKFDRNHEKSLDLETTVQKNITTNEKIKVVRFENFLKDLPFLNFDEKNSYWGTWRSGLQQGFETPILGIGPSGTRFTCGYLDKKHWLPGKNYCGNHPHNTYIQLFAETGIIGLIFFTISLFFIIQECYKARLLNKSCVMASTAFIIPIAFFFPLQQAGSFFGQWNNLFMWFSIGFALSQSNLMGSNEK